MPNFSSQAKNFIQTTIRNLKSAEIINFIISEPSHDDWGLIIINKITYIAQKIVELQPRFIFRFRNQPCSTKINHQYQNRFDTLNRLELFIKLLYVMQINNIRINEAEQIQIDEYDLNISAPEYHRQLQVNLIHTKRIYLQNRDFYENQLGQLHNNYFNYANNNSSDSEANVYDLDLTFYEVGERESLTQTILIKKSIKIQQDFNRIPLQKIFLLNTSIQQDPKINIIINQLNKQQPQTMIDKDEGEIHAYVDPNKNKMDNAVDNLLLAAGKGTKLNSKIYYDMMENKEQIISIRLQSASSAISNIINYYFETIEDLLGRPYANMMKTVGKQNIPSQIISFLKLIDKNLSYDSEAIKYCQVEWDIISNTNALNIKVPHNLVKPLQSDLIQFVRHYFKSALSLRILKFSIKSFNVLQNIKIKHTEQDQIIIQKPNLRKKNLRPSNQRRNQRQKKRSQKKRRPIRN